MPVGGRVAGKVGYSSNYGSGKDFIFHLSLAYSTTSFPSFLSSIYDPYRDWKKIKENFSIGTPRALSLWFNWKLFCKLHWPNYRLYKITAVVVHRQELTIRAPMNNWFWRVSALRALFLCCSHWHFATWPVNSVKSGGSITLLRSSASSSIIIDMCLYFRDRIKYFKRITLCL